jgi:hypothetical protein
MPTLRYIGNAPTLKTIAPAREDGRVIASAAKIGESAPSKTELQPPGADTVRLRIDNHAAAANHDDTSVMNIVKKVNRLNLDPSKGASRTDSTSAANVRELVSDKENINKASFSELRGPTKSPHTKATKRYEHQQSKIKSDIFRLANPTVPGSTFKPTPSNLFTQPTEADQKESHPFAAPTPPAISYLGTQPRYLQRDTAPVTDHGGYNQQNIIYQPSLAAAAACVQFYSDCPLKGTVDDGFDHLEAKTVLYQSDACKNSIINIASSTKSDELESQTNTAIDLNTSTYGSSGTVTTQPKTASSKKSYTTKQKKIKDSNAPKRSKSAFVFYQIEMRPFIKNEFPGISFGDTSKVLGLRWKSLESEQKRKYQIMAMNDRERYYKELAHEAKLYAEKCNSNSSGS